MNYEINYINHTDLFLCLRRHNPRRRNILRLGYILHREIMPERGNIRYTDGFWGAIRRGDSYLCSSDNDPEGLEHEVRATCTRQELGHRSHGYSDIHGHGPRAESQKQGCNNRLDAGGVPCSGRKIKRRKNKSEN